MKKIVLTRVDSRLIHGQVVTKWLQQSGATKILVISDELVKDEFLQTIYIMAAPPQIDVVIQGRDKVLEYWETIEEGRFLILTPDLETLESLENIGLLTDSIQIGGLGGAQGKKHLTKNLNVSEEDIVILRRLMKKGKKIYFQAIPEETAMDIEKLI